MGRKPNSVDETFFDRIDTEEKAYWLGFILGDGYVMERGERYRFAVCISQKDEHHLEEMCDHMELESTFVEDGDNVRVQTGNYYLCESLIEHGIVPNKTKKNTVPNIPDKLKNHFVRGLFDADGYADRNRFQITGANEDRLEKISDWIPEQTRIVRDELEDGRVWYNIRQDKVDEVQKIIEWMYRDATVMLDRKHPFR